MLTYVYIYLFREETIEKVLFRCKLKRLNMSYVDILYVHFYKYRTPIEEFMRSLDDTVRSGKALCVTVLSRFITMIADLRIWSQFRLQTRYNLLDRSMEFVRPACVEHNLMNFNSRLTIT
ncbi:hypothetical protein RhiirA4_548914 [Rhizophagus irregularis]|uniref:NADP-dependent oxidoreductase domain-containing protein n=1 Tax=Rhizophagus irregularis TaxID=588596 RepID=A0A2I1HAB2_9GLOM|nr:hypothetical protein RhiirA4_548914 [Rhizophagus irregularis]